MASRSACGPPRRSCQPSETGSPSRAITAPTRGLGLTRPRPRSAISIARARCTRSVSVRTVILRPLPRILPRVRQPASEERAAAGYGRAAAILSVALALTGLLTFGFFSAASHVLDAPSYKRIVLLWSVMFIVISTIYRPIEQLLSRTIAARRATGLHEHPLRVPAGIQVGFGLLFLAAALGARGPLQDDLFDGSATLFWALVAGTSTYGAAFFARGWLAGHKRFLTLSGLVFVDAAARLAFPLVAAAGRAAFRRAVGLPAMVIGGFSLAVTLGLLAVGPPVMHAVFGGSFHYARGGLALMGVGMGFHLLAGTLNQAALARDRASV